MCNRYLSPSAGDVERQWHLQSHGMAWSSREVFPRGQGLFIRWSGEAQEASLVAGQWGLVPWFAKSAKLPYSTNNCRWETAATAASFKQSWQRNQRCVIPAWHFFEPCWETGKNEWWQFQRADALAWALAGLWNSWTDKATGEVVESFTMLTMNADEHALMKRMHKPEPHLAPDQQDKRSVVVLEMSDVKQWLQGSQAEASELIMLAAPEKFQAINTAQAKNSLF
jgi:putative SOS response-associated peptidase YedK